jgi:hypothetical protein
MAIHEGCRRLRKAGKMLILFGLVAALLGGILFGIAYGFQIPNVGALVPFVLLIILLSVVGGGQLWFVGWVIEGFASPQSKEPERHLTR